MLEFVIAGVILVAAVVGALLWLKSVQNRQTTRPITVGSPREPWASTPDTKPVVKPPKPVPINPISALLASHEALNLGPATVQIARIATATRSPILKTTPRSGNVFAIVGLELKSVEQGPAFDSYAVSLTPPGGTPCKVVVVTGVDKKGVPYEEPRQRLNSDEVPAGKVIKIELYFQIPESMDPGTCQLLYR